MNAEDRRDFTPPRKRHSYLAVDEMRLLDWWCAALQRSFGKIPYLVGSALTRPDYRDVDIRICITDEQLRDLPLLRRDFNMMLSLWGQRATGLPIDCHAHEMVPLGLTGPSYSTHSAWFCTGASLNGSCPRDRKMSTQVSALAISRTHRYGSR